MFDIDCAFGDVNVIIGVAKEVCGVAERFNDVLTAGNYMRLSTRDSSII